MWKIQTKEASVENLKKRRQWRHLQQLKSILIFGLEKSDAGIYIPLKQSIIDLYSTFVIMVMNIVSITENIL
jgi:hypothetical protein